MNANSPVCARPSPFCTAVFTSRPTAMDAIATFTVFPTTIIAETSNISGMQRHSAAGSTSSPMETKNIAENIAFSGSVSLPSLSRKPLEPPITPTRNAPSASEKSNLYAK